MFFDELNDLPTNFVARMTHRHSVAHAICLQGGLALKLPCLAPDRARESGTIVPFVDRIG
jgi:hypothetical protein